MRAGEAPPGTLLIPSKPPATIEGMPSSESATIASTISPEQTAGDQWKSEQNDFFQAHPEYLYAQNSDSFYQLNEKVKSLARDPNNAARDGRWVLNEAHRLMSIRNLGVISH
jgi:hypothetical protein